MPSGRSGPPSPHEKELGWRFDRRHLLDLRERMRREALINVALSSWKRPENDDKATSIIDGVISSLPRGDGSARISYMVTAMQPTVAIKVTSGEPHPSKYAARQRPSRSFATSVACRAADFQIPWLLFVV
jgi:hypothetical protein